MPWRRIGVPVAVIVACLIVLGRASDFVVDWAWFSTIGYVDVFWTIFATKAVLFIAVFAVSTSLLWMNGAISLRFAWQRRLRLSIVRDPGLATVLALPGAPTGFGRVAAAAVALAHPGCRPRHRTADRDGGDRSMGPDPSVPLPGAIRPERSAV